MITCPGCRQDNADEYIYCLYCGTELKGAAQPPADEAVPLTNVKRKPVEAAAPSYSPQPQYPVQPSQPYMQAVSWDQAAPGSAYQSQASIRPAPAPEQPSAPLYTQPPVQQQYATQPPVQVDKACPKCGNLIPANFVFCGHCGYRLTESQIADTRGKTIFMHAPVIEASPKPIIRLVVVNPDGSDGATFTLSAREMLLGRSKGMMLFPDDKFISPLHARFLLDENNVLKVVDEHSLNGVYVRIKTDRELNPGDQIRMGRQLLRFDDAASIEEIPSQRGQGDDSVVLGSPVTGYWGRLVQILEGARLGDVHLLVEQEVTIGREKGEITFPMDGFMSSVHARLAFSNGRCVLKDLGSANRTYVRVKDAESLAAGDVLLIGNKLIKIDIR
ncbi:MAG: FHA domain-containing protein [Myxococcota bacterium]|jgi:pSer/pThr/pTyr-binding forkhead associated (FHA) protein